LFFYRFATYIVISNPNRQSIAVGVSHFMMVLLRKFRVKISAAKYRPRNQYLPQYALSGGREASWPRHRAIHST
jgi:hypothetical protein